MFSAEIFIMIEVMNHGCLGETSRGGGSWSAKSAVLFKPEPQATASGDAVACGSGLND